jgi:hypothetical protein
MSDFKTINKDIQKSHQVFANLYTQAKEAERQFNLLKKAFKNSNLKDMMRKNLIEF